MNYVYACFTKLLNWFSNLLDIVADSKLCSGQAPASFLISLKTFKGNLPVDLGIIFKIRAVTIKV